MNLCRPAFTPAPDVIVGQSGEKAAATPVPLSQNRIKHPRLYRSGVTVGQKWRYTTRMAHNDENSPPEYGAKLNKVSQPGLCCGATDAYDPQSIRPQLGTGWQNPGSPGWKRLTEADRLVTVGLYARPDEAGHGC